MDFFTGEKLGSSRFALAMSAITLLFTFLILMNGLKQALFKKRNEPPVVFHWLPFIGSALSYGQEPNKFLGECKAKVRRGSTSSEKSKLVLIRSLLSSTVTSSPSSFSAGKSQHIWGPRGTISSSTGNKLI